MDKVETAVAWGMYEIEAAVAPGGNCDEMIAAVKRASGAMGLQYGTVVDVDAVGEPHVRWDGEGREEVHAVVTG